MRGGTERKSVRVALLSDFMNLSAYRKILNKRFGGKL
jgi:hypothetical protein